MINPFTGPFVIYGGNSLVRESGLKPDEGVGQSEDVNLSLKLIWTNMGLFEL